MDRRYDKCFHGINKVLLGHNRSATRGGISHRAAHPFLFNHIVGCHNGTIDEADWYRLDPKKECISDSEAILWSIENKGVDATFALIGNSLNEQNGCVVWYDTRDSTLNFVKNDKRTLYYVYSLSQKTIYWGSEPELLLGSLRRNDLKIEEKCHQLNHDKWIRWKIPFNGVLVEPEVTDVKYHVKKVWGGAQNSGSNFTDQSMMKPGNLFPPQNAKPGKNTMTPGTDIIPWVGAASGNKVRPVIGVKIDDQKSPFFGSIPYFQDDKHKICWIPEHKIWLEGWMPKGHSHWVLARSKVAPAGLSYSKLDVNSRHEFKHEGKKKRKRIYYKGWHGHLLPQDTFNDFMKQGCCNCSKVPEWSNKVEFVNQDHDFLCEFCSLDLDLLTTYKEITGANNAIAC